jgi:uncharacterized delta-60 repeat protein
MFERQITLESTVGVRTFHPRSTAVLCAVALAVCSFMAWPRDTCGDTEMQWFNTFSGPGTSHAQQGLDIAIDPDGNVVVTGDAWLNFFRSSYGTLKYSPDGELLWHRYYLLDINQSSYASALAIDDHGNIYVTGEGRQGTGGSGFDTYCVTLKYSPDGTLLWEHVHAAPPSNSTRGRNLVIGPDGNIVIVGSAQIPFTDGQFQGFVLKIDPDGNTIWSREFLTSTWTVLLHIAVDSDGFISVGGSAGIWWSDTHLLVVRYAPDGTLLWSDITSGWGNIEYIWDITVDDSGNTYAVGDLAVPNINYSFHLMKYTPDGVKQWGHTLTHTGGVDRPTAVAMDPDGNVIISGNGGVGQGIDSVLIGKYTPEGQILWSLAHKGDLPWAAAYDMAIDQQGNIYTTGFGNIPGTNEYQLFTVKVDPDGNVCWTETFSNDPILGPDFGNAIAVNDNGDAFIAGGTWFDYHYYYATLKYAAPGGPIPGDLNGDGVVDGADLLILLSAWGNCADPDDCPADLDKNGIVDGSDLLILLSNWG